MAFADVFLGLTVIFIGIGITAVIAKRPAQAPQLAGDH
jgi:hypothetical protein